MAEITFRLPNGSITMESGPIILLWHDTPSSCIVELEEGQRYRVMQPFDPTWKAIEEANGEA